MKLSIFGGVIAFAAADSVDFHKEVLRRHNVYRCMHGLPLMQWSYALQDEAKNRADETFPSTETESVVQVRGNVFKDWAPIDQHAVLFHSVVEPLKDSESFGDWEQQIKNWYDAKGIERSSMLQPSATYVGCGGRFEGCPRPPSTTTGGPPLGSVSSGSADEKCTVTFFCNYVGPEDGKGTKLTTGEPVKKEGECENAVDSMFPPADLQPRKVLISYKLPEGLRAGSQTCETTGGTIAKYRLVINRWHELKLIAVDGTDTPCAKHYEHYTRELQWWESSDTGMFSRDTDKDGDGNHLPKVCLQAGPENDGGNHGLGTNPVSSRDKACTINNKPFPDGFWHFQQEFEDTPWADFCMQDVPEANGAELVVQSTFLAGTGACSDRWIMEDFSSPAPGPQDLQTTLRVEVKKKTCKECLSEIGSFSCVRGEQCMLAPTELACRAQDGEWCAAPQLKFPLCAGGHDDWLATKTKRRECKGGCSYDVCQKKIDSNTNPKLAVDHCYTLAEIANDGSLLDPSNDHPRGCNYGPRDTDNTCAVDDQGDCVYADLGSDDLMVIV